MEPKSVAVGPIDCFSQGKVMLGDQYMTFVLICLLNMLVAGAVPIVLVGPMFCGMMLCYLLCAQRKKVDINTLFKGFDYFMPGLIVTLIVVGIAIVASMPGLFMIIVGMVILPFAGDSPIGLIGIPIIMMGYLYMILLNLMFLPLQQFAFTLVVERNMQPMDAIKLSLVGIKKNFFGILGLGFIGGLIMMVGAMLCFIGMFFAAPILYGGIFVAYQKIYGTKPVMSSTSTAGFQAPPSQNPQNPQTKNPYSQRR